MNRTDIDREVAHALGISIELVSTVTLQWFETAKAKLAAGDEVHVRFFGTFRPGRRAASTITTIAGLVQDVPAIRTVGFRATGALRKAMNR